MSYNEMEYKKPFYKVRAFLRDHLEQYSRTCELPLKYEDLQNYQELIPTYDKEGNETLWYAVLFHNSDIDKYNEALIRIYELLVADGDKIPFLKVDTVEFCSYGNSKPYRVKIINEANDNHDYYYIKKADASRIYGLELEEILSPDKVSFLVNQDTLIEEHVVGVPCDEFITKHKTVKIENRLRFAKEFVKFNERCFVRLLGDMRAYNFVVEIIQDFDNVQYRFRAMDFDQQSYEGRKNIYLPQYYKDNVSLVALCQELLSAPIAEQYAREERVAMKKRFIAGRKRLKSLLRRMRKDKISNEENIVKLSNELAVFHDDNSFKEFNRMGDILSLHLEKKLGVSL